MMSFQALLKAYEEQTIIWTVDPKGHIISGQIQDLSRRSRNEAQVKLKNIKYQNDTLATFETLDKHSDNLYKTEKAAMSDHGVKTRATYMATIKTCYDLYLFMRQHDVKYDAIACDVAMIKAKQFDNLIKNGGVTNDT